MKRFELAEAGQALQAARRRFEALAERERLLLLAAGAALAFMVGDALWLGPATQAWKQARQQHQQVAATIGQLRSDGERLREVERRHALELQQELALWRDKVRQGDGALRQREAALVGPEQMRELLEQLLAGQGELRVRAMQSLPRVDELAARTPAAAAPGTAAAPPGTAAASAPAAGTEAGRDGRPLPALYRHGIEVTLEGSFADLLAYLQALEAAPQRLIWGGMQFKVEQYPKAVLTLRLHTLSLDRHWLEI